MTTDEFGIEIDADVERALADPKSGTLQKLLDYRDKRKAAEQAKADKESEENAVKETSWFNFS